MEYAKGVATGYGSVTEAAKPGAGETLLSALDCLNRVEGAVEMIEDRLHGPRPRPAETASGPMAPPHLRQSAELLNNRLYNLAERLSSIAGAL